jgi:hypothetical protein
MDQIFVQIPAYRDAELINTLDSLLGQARHPARLRVRICWQCAQQDELPPHYLAAGNVEIDRIDYRRTRGANWARRRAQEHWRGEPYSLIIDSHPTVRAVLGHQASCHAARAESGGRRAPNHHWLSAQLPPWGSARGLVSRTPEDV